jgi:transcription elongation GreA/GreB family factor
MTPVLAIRDYRHLRQLFERLNGSKEPFERIVRQKLQSARLLLPGETAEPLVRLGSRIRFRIASAAPEERTLVLAADYTPDGRCLALDSPIGVALLGHQAGDVIEAEWRSDCPEPIAILDVRNALQPAPIRGGIVVPFPGSPVTQSTYLPVGDPE